MSRVLTDVEIRSQLYKREIIYDAAHDLVSTGESIDPDGLSYSYSETMERLFQHLVKLCKEFENV